MTVSPGKGSSAVYTEDVLRRDGAVAFPAGTHSYVNHLQEGEIRSPEKLWGVLSEDAYYEDGVGLVAKIKVMPHWADFVEAVAPHTGLSIFVEGLASKDDNGELLVESFLANPTNTVDMVSWPGRKGSGLASKLYESAVRASESDNGYTSGDTVSIIEEGYSDMELKELSDQIAEMPNLIAAAVAEALAPAAEPEEKEEEVSVEAVAEALVAADLPEVSRKAVYESLRNGGDLTVAIEAQKAFVAQVKEHLAESVKADAVRVEETLIVNTPEAAAKTSLSGLLNIKVGA